MNVRNAISSFLLLCVSVSIPCMGMDAERSSVERSIVKIYTIRNTPDYYNPWSMQGPRRLTGSGCIISGRKILTNGHVVGDETFIQVRRHGDPKKYRARVESVSHDADLAILTVDDPAFFQGTVPLEFGELPESQQEVVVYGFPLGGDVLSTTKGVISRIEHRSYAHSSQNLLAGQIDAAINPGSSGGPVLMDGRIVGVVMQGMPQGENIGYMVPVNIIHHFLDDIRDGSYDGFPSIGLVMDQMENPDMKRAYKMKSGQTGMLILSVVHGSPAESVVMPGDVLLSVAGQPVADDGTVEFRPESRTSVSYYIQEKQIGDSIDLEVLRSGVVKKLTIKLARSVADDLLIPMQQYDVIPTYYIYGGLVFMPLNKDLMMAWGPDWYNRAPKPWVTMLGWNFVSEEQDEVVVMLKVLADDVNQGYHEHNNMLITEVDGTPFRNLKELIEMLEGGQNTNEFVRFQSRREREIVLDREKAKNAKARILRLYRVPADRSEDLVTTQPGPFLKNL